MNAVQKAIIYAKMSIKAMIFRPSAETFFGAVKYFYDWWQRSSISLFDNKLLDKQGEGHLLPVNICLYL